jgi:hypothetical protein
VGLIVNLIIRMAFAAVAILVAWRAVKDAVTDDSAVTLPPSKHDILSPMFGARGDVNGLKAIDPNFNDIEFLAQAAQTYQASLAAQAAMDIEKVSAITTKRFRDCLAATVSERRVQDLMEHVSDVEFNPSKIVRVSVAGTQHVIVVRFNGTWVRYTANASTCILTEGSTQPQAFTEFATFVRPAGTTTPKPIGAGAPPHCPGCGAPTRPGTVICPFCSTPLTGTGGTWLLDGVSASPYVS